MLGGGEIAAAAGQICRQKMKNIFQVLKQMTLELGKLPLHDIMKIIQARNIHKIFLWHPKGFKNKTNVISSL